MNKANHEEAVGLGGPEFHLPIEQGKVREFARTLFAFRPDYLEERHPPMFPTQTVVAGYSWGYMLEDPQDTDLAKVEINPFMSLDAEQEFIFPDGPPRAGVDLMSRTWIDRIWEKQGRKGGKLTFYRTRSDYRQEDGSLAIINYSTSVVPEGVPDTPFPEFPDGNVPFMGDNDRRDHFMAISEASWEDLVAGRSPGPVVMPPLTLTEVVAYQIVSGSFGPPHHDHYAARASGFPTWFSIGMFHAGLLATYAVNWLGPTNIRRIKYRFTDMMWPGDEFDYEGKVARTRKEEGERMVDIELACTRRNGNPVTTGEATFVVPD